MGNLLIKIGGFHRRMAEIFEEMGWKLGEWRSKRGIQFRIWANRNLKAYIVKGFVMDEERLKNPDGRPDAKKERTEQLIGLLAEYRTALISEAVTGKVKVLD